MKRAQGRYYLAEGERRGGEFGRNPKKFLRKYTRKIYILPTKYVQIWAFSNVPIVECSIVTTNTNRKYFQQ